MTTISAGAAAGLLVALMVVATSDSRAAEMPMPANDVTDIHVEKAIIADPRIALEAPRSAAR